MHRARLSGRMNAQLAAAIACILAMAPAIAAARAGESAHLELGIVGADEVARAGAVWGVRVIELFGPRSLRGDLRRGDVVLRVDGRRVHDGDELAEALGDRGGDSFRVEVLRHGRIRELRVPGERRLRLRGVFLDGDREVIRAVVRDVRRDFRSDAWRDFRRDVRRDVVRTLRQSIEQVRRRLREIEIRLDAEGWL